MNRFRIQCLFLSLTCTLLLRCTSAYQALHTAEPDAACAKKIRPSPIATSWYHAAIEVTGKHLSGLILIKTMPDSSRRIVFTSESGLSLFDFGFDVHGNFRVYSIISKLNRKPVIITLRKDFELLLGYRFTGKKLASWSDGNEIFFGVKQNKETAYFITGKECGSLSRLELGSARKRKVSIQIDGPGALPSAIKIQHYTFPMEIQLNRFEKDDAAR